jgi:hypothetical protein
MHVFELTSKLTHLWPVKRGCQETSSRGRRDSFHVHVEYPVMIRNCWIETWLTVLAIDVVDSRHDGYVPQRHSSAHREFFSLSLLQLHLHCV